MSGQRKCIRVWVRTIGMPIGYNDIDEPIINPSIKQKDVKSTLGLKSFWIFLHNITCLAILRSKWKEIRFRVKIIN